MVYNRNEYLSILFRLLFNTNAPTAATSSMLLSILFRLLFNGDADMVIYSDTNFQSYLGYYLTWSGSWRQGTTTDFFQSYLGYYLTLSLSSIQTFTTFFQSYLGYYLTKWRIYTGGNSTGLSILFRLLFNYG